MVDRQKTGPLKVLGEKEFVPGPCSYAVEAEQQVGACVNSLFEKQQVHSLLLCLEKRCGMWGEVPSLIWFIM